MKINYKRQQKRQYIQLFLGALGALGVIVLCNEIGGTFKDNTVGLIVFWIFFWVWVMSKTRIKLPCKHCEADLTKVIAQAEIEKLKVVACPFCGKSIH